MENIREICLDDFEIQGEGGTAKSYYSKTDDSIMLKLFDISNGYDVAKVEYERAMAVYELNLPSPKPIEMVTCNGFTGIIYERIKNKKSFARICADDPDNIPKYAKEYARACKRFHNTKISIKAKKIFPNRKEYLLNLVKTFNISDESKDILLGVINNVGDGDTCVHGDFHIGNVCKGWCEHYEGRKQEEGEEDHVYYIDLSDFSYGNPLLDLGHLYQCYINNASYDLAQEGMHLNEQQILTFGKYFLMEYFDVHTEEELTEVKNKLKKFAPLGMIVGFANPKSEKRLPEMQERLKRIANE